MLTCHQGRDGRHAVDGAKHQRPGQLPLPAVGAGDVARHHHAGLGRRSRRRGPSPAGRRIPRLLAVRSAWQRAARVGQLCRQEGLCQLARGLSVRCAQVPALRPRVVRLWRGAPLVDAVPPVQAGPQAAWRRRGQGRPCPCCCRRCCMLFLLFVSCQASSRELHARPPPAAAAVVDCNAAKGRKGLGAGGGRLAMQDHHATQCTLHAWQLLSWVLRGKCIQASSLHPPAARERGSCACQEGAARCLEAGCCSAMPHGPASAPGWSRTRRAQSGAAAGWSQTAPPGCWAGP